MQREWNRKRSARRAMIFWDHARPLFIVAPRLDELKSWRAAVLASVLGRTGSGNSWVDSSARLWTVDGRGESAISARGPGVVLISSPFPSLSLRFPCTFIHKGRVWFQADRLVTGTISIERWRQPPTLTPTLDGAASR